ncbi:MAG TPA: hypothetical protein VK920_01370 [Solirubrobacterales bacterium]|nr:hypothetical protein [Solirubrobacterales bacterium]
MTTQHWERLGGGQWDRRREREHQEALKVQVLPNSLAIVLFLWFLGSLWSRLRAAEGGPARVSAIASAGGIAGAAAVLMGSCSRRAP